MSRPKLKKLKPNLYRAAQMCAAGCELFWAGKLKEAERLFRITLSVHPTLYEGWQNLGSSLVEQGRHDSGIKCHQRAIAINPQRPTSHHGVGVSLYLQRDIRGAIESARNAIKADPGYMDARLLLGHCLIISGDYLAGWSEHEKSRIENYNQDFPLWNGEDLSGKRILLICEQGFGDDLHFIRYAKLVKSMGARVIVGCKPPLSRLFRSVPWIDDINPFDIPAPEFDYFCPLMRLPYVLGTTIESIPAPIPYFYPEDRKVREWDERLGEDGRLRVGLCWAGGRREHDPKANRIDRRRSISLQQFAPFFDVPGAKFYSLQKGDGSDQTHPNLIDYTGEFLDFMDTAAFVENLDLVITVDTAVAHLAGGLGKPVWMLSRFDGCWRWGLSGEHTPWYPTMTIFRQEKPGDWSGAIKDITGKLIRRS